MRIRKKKPRKKRRKRKSPRSFPEEGKEKGKEGRLQKKRKRKGKDPGREKQRRSRTKRNQRKKTTPRRSSGDQGSAEGKKPEETKASESEEATAAPRVHAEMQRPQSGSASSSAAPKLLPAEEGAALRTIRKEGQTFADEAKSTAFPRVAEPIAEATTAEQHGGQTFLKLQCRGCKYKVFNDTPVEESGYLLDPGKACSFWSHLAAKVSHERKNSWASKAAAAGCKQASGIAANRRAQQQAACRQQQQAASRLQLRAISK